MSVTESHALSLFEQYPTSKYNLLLPTTAAVDVSLWHRMAVSIVVVDPDPRKGDVYPVASRAAEGPDGKVMKSGGKTVYEDLYSLSRPATDRIGTAAGITYKPLERGGVVEARADYVLCQAVGAIRRPDGTWMVTPALSKELDLRVIEMEIREKATNALSMGVYGEEAKRAAALYRGNWGPDPNHEGWQRFFIDPSDLPRAIDDRVRPQLIQWRKNKLMRAETGARLRVIRGLLGIRLQYTAEELQLPFVVPRIDFAPDMSDPDVKRLVITQGTIASSALYGGRAGQSVEIPASARVMDIPEDDEDAGYRILGTETPESPVPSSQASEPASVAGAVPSTGGGASTQPTPADGPQADAAGHPGEQQATGLVCSVTTCQAPISEKVAQYSRQRFGKALCFNCQQLAKAGGGGHA